MFEKYLEKYILKIESIKLIKETIEKNLPNRINKEINKYQDAILMDIYFNELLLGKKNERLEQYVKKYVTVTEVKKEEKKVIYKFNNKGYTLDRLKDIDESRKVMSNGLYTFQTMYNNILISILIEFENMINIILIVVGVVLILLGIAIIIRLK